MPEIFAPMAMRQRARSSISGSRAALPIRVSPLARVAAISAVSVAPTETKGNSMRAPFRPLWRRGDDIAIFQRDGGAQRFQRLQVQIDRPGADGAAAGERDLGLAMAGQQRRQHLEAGAHFAHHVVGGEGGGMVAAWSV